MGGLLQQAFISLSSEGWKSKTRVLAWLGSGEILFLDFRWLSSYGGREGERERLPFIFYFILNFTYLFLETKEGRKREGEKHQCVVASRVPPPLGTWPATQACALTGNQTGDTLVHRPAPNPLSHTSQGYLLSFN